METTLERSAAPEQHKPTPLRTEADHSLTDARAVQCKAAPSCEINKFPTVKDLLGELDKDAQLARSGHLNGTDAAT